MTDKQFLVYVNQLYLDIKRISNMMFEEEIIGDDGRLQGAYEWKGDLNEIHLELEQLLSNISTHRKILGENIPDNKEGK